MGSRPRLKPDFRPLRRGRGAVQLGASTAAGGIILAGLAPGEIALLDQLDGSHPEEDLYASAARAGVEPDRAARLLDLLRTHRVLRAEERARGDPARSSAARPAPVFPVWVVVDGTGPFTATVAALLRAGDLGPQSRVDAGAWAADLADAELRAGGRLAAVARPALMVLVHPGPLDPRAGEPWRRRGIPVLPVGVDDERVVVGPVVGADPALPCLRCLRLHRVDRDAAWVAAVGEGVQRRGGDAAASDSGNGRREPPDLRPDLASIAAGLVAMVAQAVLGDDPVPPGVSVEVAAPWPRLDHRRWTRHPACPAHRPPDVPSDPGAPPEGPAKEPTRLG